MINWVKITDKTQFKKDIDIQYLLINAESIDDKASIFSWCFDTFMDDTDMNSFSEDKLKKIYTHYVVINQPERLSPETSQEDAIVRTTTDKALS